MAEEEGGIYYAEAPAWTYLENGGIEKYDSIRGIARIDCDVYGMRRVAMVFLAFPY